MLEVGALLSRRLVLAGLGLSSAWPIAPLEAQGTAGEWIDRNDRARGGKARLAPVRSMDAVVRIVEPTYTVIGRYLAHRSGLMRIDVFGKTKRVFSEGIDSTGAWSWPGDAPAPSPVGAKARAALEHGIVYHLVPLSAVGTRGHRLTLVSDTPPCLEITFADGAEARLFLDPSTSHIVRRQDRRAYHPDVDSTEKRIESRFSDFRAQDGIVSPWLAEDYDLDSGARIGRTETLSLGWDSAVLPLIRRDAPAHAPPAVRS
ncbi:hypothetical protein [Sphingomonas sp.]|jgi:hypothetical protein|uniref:hypothetical protein n=1 Tax=Sphingomonas sp. TaxID=28214 RepID=UPI002DEBD207|nr:hypothetical protein [Sphingomonas sp.]